MPCLPCARRLNSPRPTPPADGLFPPPPPPPDTRHTSRFLSLWLATLPFVLWNHIGWGIVPSTAVISFLLFGIDEIAIQLEVGAWGPGGGWGGWSGGGVGWGGVEGVGIG
jgi:hypothetical protein